MASLSSSVGISGRGERGDGGLVGALGELLPRLLPRSETLSLALLLRLPLLELREEERLVPDPLLSPWLLPLGDRPSEGLRRLEPRLFPIFFGCKVKNKFWRRNQVK